MSLVQKLGTTVGFLVILLGLGSADAYFMKDHLVLPALTEGIATAEGISPIADPDVFATLEKHQITSQEVSEQSFLDRIMGDKTPVTTRVLLKDNDRLALFSFADSPQIKTYFNVLKETLHASFSPQVTDLLDTTEEPEGKPIRNVIRNVLTFRDPAISEERILFLRVRERLYEFHVVEGQGDTIQEIIDELTQ
jgi:hypothetical protein